MNRLGTGQNGSGHQVTTNWPLSSQHVVTKVCQTNDQEDSEKKLFCCRLTRVNTRLEILWNSEFCSTIISSGKKLSFGFHNKIRRDMIHFRLIGSDNLEASETQSKWVIEKMICPKRLEYKMEEIWSHKHFSRPVKIDEIDELWIEVK